MFIHSCYVKICSFHIGLGVVPILEIGDAVIYPFHGAGRVIDEKTIEREGEENEYYVVDILLKQQTVMLPKGELEEVGVRKPTDPEEFYERLEEVREVMTEEYDPEEGTHAEKIHQKTLESMLDDVRQGNINTMMESLAMLHTRFLDQELNVTEKRVYDTARHFAIGEIMAIEDCSEQEAEEKLSEYLLQRLPEPEPEEEEEENGEEE